jgi:hypothetical protein
VVGFNPSHFTVRPFDGKPFRVHSGMNNLCVMGRRFAERHEDVGLAADLSSKKTAELHVYFKSLDPEQQLVLFMRHWKLNETGIHVSVRINDTAVVERHVDSAMIADGSQNVTTVILRNTDFGSYEFFDYLKLGLNHLHIRVRAEDPEANSCGYVLHTLAIG